MAAGSYTPQTWANGSGGGTPTSAARFTVMETGIKNQSDRLDSLEPRVTTLESGAIEAAQDAAAALLTSGVHTGISFVYDDTNNRVNATATGGGGTGGIDAEGAQDAAASLFTTGTHTGISFAYDDVNGKVNATVTGGGGTYTDEQVRDVMGVALVAGANVTITPNDAADTITIAAATSGAAGIPATLVDAKGDLIAATAADAVARLPVGADGQVLTASAAASTGLAWTTPASGGASGQIVYGYVPSGSTTPTITHSLGTTDLAAVTVQRMADGLIVGVTVDIVDANSIQLTFSAAPTANQYRYVIVAPGAQLAAPQVRDAPVVQAYAASLTPNAAAGNFRALVATGDLTLNEPTNGVDGQTWRMRVTASGAQRVVTYAAALKRPSSIASTLTIPSGTRGHIALFYEAAYGWTVGTSFAA